MSQERAPHRTAARMLSAAQKQVKALRLRQKGHSYRQIADALGIVPSAAYRMVSAALAEIRAECKEEAIELREIEIAKLDAAEKEAWKRMRGADDADAAKLLNTIKAISESRRKLTGLDAPVKVEHTGKLYTVAAASPDCVEWSTPLGQAAERVKDETQDQGGAVCGADADASGLRGGQSVE